MAVPFSRPQYAAGSGVFRPPMPMRSRRRRPGLQPPRQQQHPQSQGALPIQRLLNGDHLDLRGLSFTSRLAFYALYEAWRLLQNLTGSTGDNTIAHHTTPADTATPKARLNTDSCLAGSASASSAATPVPGSTRSEDHVVSNCRENLGSAGPAQHLSLPDIVPPDHPREDDAKWNEQVIVYQDEDDGEEEEGGGWEEDADYENDWLDASVGVNSPLKKCFARPPPTSSWGAVGLQLCQIASAFEIGFCSASDERQRRMFLTYQAIKLRALRRDMKVANAASCGEGSESHLTKSVCRQILLSGIWLLIKKVL